MTITEKIIIVIVFILFTFVGQSENPITPHVTKQTKALYNNLFDLSKKGFMFGHQDANYYGHDWFEQSGRGDVKEVCGSHPAVYGSDFIDITNLAVSMDERNAAADKLRERIRDAYSRGGINTITWHFINPVSKKSFYYKDDPTPSVRDIIPGGKHNGIFKEVLSYVADFAASLTTLNGELIPVIFRPWHEYDGDWFWWGVPYHCTREEFLSLWHFTVDYLRDECKVKNFIYAISPDCGFNSIEEFETYYPGDNYTDLVGMDNYWDLRADGGDSKFFVKKLAVLDQVAKKHKKLAAITETGLESIPNQNWWTEVLLKLIKESGAKLSYVMVWRNAYQSPTHYYAPYPKHQSCDNFIKFYNDPMTYFENNLPKMYK